MNAPTVTLEHRELALEQRTAPRQHGLALRQHWQALAGALLLFLGVFLGYEALLPRLYSGDDLQYAIVIDQATTGSVFYHPAGGRPFEASAQGASASTSATPLNPRYLLEWPTSVLAVQAWHHFGWTGDVILPILTLRALVGAAGIVFFFLALQVWCKRALIAGIASAGLATSAAYWTYSSHLDQSINMVALTCLALYLLALQTHAFSPVRSTLVLPAVLAVATFYNFTAVFTVAAFSLVVAMQAPAATTRGKVGHAVRFLSVYGVLVVVVLALAIAVWVSPSSLFSADYWRSVTFYGHPEYNAKGLRDVLRAGIAFAKAQIDYPGEAGSLQEYWNGASASLRASLVGFYALILLVMALPVAVSGFLRRQVRYPSLGWKHMGWGLVGWLLLFSLFNWRWDPGYIKYWLLPLVAWWTIVAFALHHLWLARARAYRWAMIAVALLAAATFASNVRMQFLPQHSELANPWRAIAQQLGASPSNALFISAGTQPLDFYLAYFGHRDIVSTSLLSYGTDGNQSAVSNVVAAHVEQHLAAGGPIYVYGLDTLSPAERDQLFLLLPSRQLTLAWSFPQLTVYRVAPAAGSGTGD